MKEQTAILEGIQDAVRNVLGDNRLTLQLATHATDVAGWDSMAHINIVIAIEELFGIRFSSSDLAAMRKDGHTIGDLVDRISNRVGP